MGKALCVGLPPRVLTVVGLVLVGRGTARCPACQWPIPDSRRHPSTLALGDVSLGPLGRSVA